MIFLRKKIFLILLLITIPIMALFYHISNPINSQNSIVYGKENELTKYTEKISPLIIKENNDLICDSSTGICGPPPGWN
jgi:hypothetical protein